MSDLGDFLITDSITTLDERARGRVALAASHAGAYVGDYVARLGLAAVVLCDAGVGRDGAGIAGLARLQDYGVAAAAISHRSARIGDASDCMERGRISYANAAAREVGVCAGMGVRAALALLRHAPRSLPTMDSAVTEARKLALRARGGRPAVWLLDSAALIEDADKDAIVITGSHGALLGGRPETAIKKPVLAAVYNDADRGVDEAGLSRLPALDRYGVAGATVSAWSACIGDAESTFEDGVVSAINESAASLGAELGMKTIEMVRLIRDSIRKSGRL